MTLTYLFLAAAYACSGYLMAFAALYAAATLVFLCVSRDRRRFDADPGAAVAVLIPALNEGAALVDCARSVLEQDHPGPLSVRLLVKDGEDTAVPALREAYPAAVPADAGRTLLLSKAPGRELLLVFTGLTPKSAKLNAELDRVAEPYVAFLDADHLAHRGWLRTSLALMRESGRRAVQARRWPLSASGVYRLWDALQHHVGVQCLNFVYRRLGLEAQFTGTTALFDRAVFAGRRFDEKSLTEDTDLFYGLLAAGEGVAFNPYQGSSEDLSPDLYSFVSRRRRWSQGHTRGFLAHWDAVLGSGARRRVKLQFLAHGQFYLASLAILALHLLMGGFFFLQMPGGRRAAVAGAGALAAALLAWRLRGPTPRARFADFLVGWVWAAPIAALAATLWMKLSGDLAFLYMVPFPHEKVFAGLCAAGVGAPLTLLLAGALRLEVLSLLHLAAGLACFPFILFLDIYGNLLGLADCVSGMKAWKAIRRSSAAHLERHRPAGTRPAPQRYSARPATLAWGALLLVVPPLLAHDYAYYQTCGKGAGLLDRPFFDLRYAPLEFYTWTEKRRDGPDGVAVTATAEVIQAKPERELTVEFLLDGRPLETQTVREDYRIVSATARFPLGWEQKEIRARVSGKGFRCESVERVSTDFKEVSGRRLLVNGEPFLVKGVVPSFSHPTMGVPLERGYALIKELGANTLRLYHPPTDAIRRAAAQARLLVIDQADASTWDNMDLGDRGARDALRRRYHRLQEENHGFPYALIHNLGNELDLGLPQERWEKPLKELLKGLEAVAGGEIPPSYATHRLDADLRTAVRSVNMLDTGRAYWEQGLAAALARPGPLLAGEFGGFLGAVEVVPSWLRTARFLRQWQALLSGGAVGGVFFESHDNWAQPQFKRVTDPFSADAPDDRRGIWDRAGNAGPEADALRDLYSDVELSEEKGIVSARNRRPYGLHALSVRGWGAGPLALGDLPPGAKRALGPGPVPGPLRFEYTTHRGLPGLSWARLPRPPPAETLPVEELQASLAGGPWGPFDAARLADGEVRLRFRAPPIGGREAVLVLEGLRARRAALRRLPDGPELTRTIPEGLPYEEQLFELSGFGRVDGAAFELVFSRDLRRDISGRPIELAPPVVAARRAEPAS